MLELHIWSSCINRLGLALTLPSNKPACFFWQWSKQTLCHLPCSHSEQHLSCCKEIEHFQIYIWPLNIAITVESTYCIAARKASGKTTRVWKQSEWSQGLLKGSDSRVEISSREVSYHVSCGREWKKQMNVWILNSKSSSSSFTSITLQSLLFLI